jgi:hypothetical protein
MTVFQIPRRIMYSAIVGGALLALAGGAVLAGHDTGVANASAGHAVVCARVVQGKAAARILGIGGMRQGRELKVTAVNGNTITATGPGGQQVTVDVSGSTTYSRAGQSASLADVKVGETIAVKGQIDRTTRTIQATSVTIVLPATTGVVTAVNGNTLTITDLNAIQRTITLDGSTVYKRGGQTAAQGDVAVGSLITAQGTLNGDGSLTAALVTIHLPRLAGTVSGLQNGQFTLTTPDGSTYTVQTSASTTYSQPGYGTATSAALKDGGRVVVEGSLSSDGKTMTADQITIMPNFAGGRGMAAGAGNGSGAGA